MKDEALENNIASLHSRGWSIRRLAREFGVSRRRVGRILEQNAKEREKGNDKLSAPAKRPSKLDPFKEYIAELLEKYDKPPITNQRIFELAKEKGYEGSLTIVRDYLAQRRGKKIKEPVVMVETAPGQRASHDWSDYHIDFANAQSEKISFLSVILNYSRRQYIEIVDDKSQATLLGGLINAFIHFDGTPREVKSDNQKACVDRWELGSPVFNKTYLGFATHYRFRPLAIRPGKPQENLKVERPFYYFETNFLNGRRFADRQDLKKQLQQWLSETNDQRVHRTTGRKPIELFVEEHAFLQPLPASHYDASLIEYRIVNNESAIQWNDYYYVVPSQYMYETCPVRANKEEIVIYSPDCRQIARYRLAEKGRKERYIGRKTKNEKPVLKLADVAARLKAFGPGMESYILGIKKRKPTNYAHHWRALLSLKANYRTEDIIAAVRRALKYRVFECSAIENFLKVNAAKKSEIDFSDKTAYSDE